MRDSSALSKIVNQSGFPLQLAIDRMVTEKSSDIGWSVLYREHGWKHVNGESGFADLVLENQHRTSVLVIECKRVLDSDWIFLEESGKTNQTLRERAWVNEISGKGHRGYFDLRLLPESPSSMYCIIAGQDSKSRPLLERIAAETTSATEAIAIEEFSQMATKGYGFRMYSSLVVTTARLSVTSVDLSKISLSTGEASDLVHREVPWLRFRKQFSSEFAIQPKDLDSSFSDFALAREKSVFVVNASNLAKFLKEFDIIGDSLRPLM
jgi:hypothetical protein